MAKLFKASTLGVFSKRKPRREAVTQAKKVGAKVGKASEKARAASEREFETQTVSELLGGNAGAGFGSSRPKTRKPLRAR